MRFFFALLLTVAVTPALHSQQDKSERKNFVKPPRPVHTFSIVARDPATGELGVAVQSHWFSVGSIVPWAEAGVGAVATQSFVDPSYGKLGLDLMRTGKSGPEVSIPYYLNLAPARSTALLAGRRRWPRGAASGND